MRRLRKGIEYYHSISTRGGYLWEYTVDLSERWGEGEATDTQIWVQPPGTPDVGDALLRAYKSTGERFYLSCVENAADALIWGQKAPGGWEYKIDFNKNYTNNYCTFDDNNTQSALRFLMALDIVIQKESLHNAVIKGLNMMLESQFENGAWPQWYPLRGGYHDFYTFNDNAMNDCINVMFDAHKHYGKVEYLERVKKAGDLIILSQYPSPQPGWGQQYNHSLEIDWARSFEPPAVCSAVTRRNIDTLIEIYLYTGLEKYLSTIPAAIEWLENSPLSEGIWARFYEIGTNIPIYCDRDRKIVYDINELGEERRTGYSWQSGYGIESTINKYNKLKAIGREEYLKEREETLSTGELQSRLNSLASSCRNIINSQDGNGRWVSDGRIKSSDFIKNINKLCDYVETYSAMDKNTLLYLESYEIYQNYPNPFNGKTKIEYKVPELSNVKVEIYNIIGQKVKTLIDSEQSPGYYEVYWDGTNNQGQSVSSGQYIARIQANKNFKNIKMVYLR